MRRYGSISEQAIFKNGIQRKEEVAIFSLLAISLPETPTCPGHHKKSTDILNCSREYRNENRNYRIKGVGLNLKGVEHRDEIEEKETDTIQNVLILSAGIRRNAEIIAWHSIVKRQNWGKRTSENLMLRLGIK